MKFFENSNYRRTVYSNLLIKKLLGLVKVMFGRLQLARMASTLVIEASVVRIILYFVTLQMNLCWSCSNQWVLRQLMLKFVVLVLLLEEMSSCLKFSCCLLSINFDYEQTLSSPRPYWGSFSRWPVTFVIISWSVLNFSIRRRALQMFCVVQNLLSLVV